MNKQSKRLLTLLAGCLIVLLATSTCRGRVTLADYGDAPDGDLGMDTGYYAFVGGPWFYTLQSAGIPAKFPTVGQDAIPGPFMLDVDDFFIGPLYGAFSANDIPSLEDDATDLNDPDSIPNLQQTSNQADCDRENGRHNPAATGCRPVAPSLLLMNARLLIFFGYPPLGIFITGVNTMADAQVSGPAYWNLAIDLNQDGAWGSGEWIVKDMAVTLTPGERTTLISGAFKWPTSGTPWGRLIFPLWARSMVTLERLGDVLGGTTWDGRGIEGGFSHGEVEDYFLEWSPIGQIFPEQLLEEEEVTLCSPEHMTHVDCPEGLAFDEASQCTTSGPELGALNFYCVPSADEELVPLSDEELIQRLIDQGYIIDPSTPEGQRVSEGRVTVEQGSGSVCQMGDFGIDVEFSVSGTLGAFNLTPFGAIPEGFSQIFIITAPEPILPSEDNPESQLCLGTMENWLFSGRFDILNQVIAEKDTALDIFGIWLFESVVKSDPSNHHFRTNLPGTLPVTASKGSISFEGSPPWVNVSGELNDNGSFYATGRGTVAGYPNIAVTFSGQISGTSLSGDYTMGAEGGLPGGQPIIYGITGTRAEETSAEEAEEAQPLSEGVLEAIQAFASVFNQAFLDGDADSLLALLHTSIFDIYGEEACQSHIDLLIENQVQIEFLDAAWVGQWDLEQDDIVTPLSDIYAVDVNLTAGGQTNLQEIHLVLPGDDSVRWLTDCGDPLP